MCIFSRPASVSTTRIFARRCDAETKGPAQYLAYTMRYAAATDLAMILPIPVTPGGPEDAVAFVDLSGYPDFFSDLANGFRARDDRGSYDKSSRRVGAPRQKLAVHDVGDFAASFVPSQKDFDRLDEQFRLPPDLWGQLPQYRNFGFVVAKLKQDRRGIHPLAFRFPTNLDKALFFPTVHIHDQKIEEHAHFDHALYCQADVSGDIGRWEISSRAAVNPHQDALFAREFVDVRKARGLVDPDAICRRLILRGDLPNMDQLVGG